MKPVNFDSAACSPISSNCVIWQGPDITCINLCNGDTISDVVYKSATELCTIMDQLNVSNYDLSCFNITDCKPNDFNALIQFLIEKICELQGITPATEKAGGGCPTDCIVTVAECFKNTLGLTTNLVDYVNAIASRVCQLAADISGINDTLNQLLIDVEVIRTTYCQDCESNLQDAVIGCTTLYTIPGELPPISASQKVDVFLKSFFAADGVWCNFFSALTGASKATDISALTTSFNPVAPCELSNFENIGVIIGQANNLPDALTNIWKILCALSTPVTVAAQNTSTIRTTVTGGPDYVVSSKINDTGWKYLEGFSFASSYTYRPRVRRIGNVLHFAGTAVVPMGADVDSGGASGKVISENSTLSLYETKMFGMTANSWYSTDPDACQIYVGTAGDPVPYEFPIPATSSKYGNYLYFNRGNGVLPSGILTSGETIDSNAYRQGNINILERYVPVTGAGGRRVEMNTTVRIQLIASGNNVKLQMVAVTNREAFHPDQGITYSSGLRSLISHAISGKRVPYIDGSQPGFQTGGTSTGVYNMQGDSTNTHTDGLNDPYGSDATWGHNQDAGDALQLGGFVFSLDGLTAFVDPCTTEIVDYKTCTPT